MTDSDNDGMDDQWELDQWETLTRDGTGDFDNDGATDLFEFQTGTDPKNPDSLFKGQLLLTEASGQNLALKWPAFPGRAYGVQYKDDLNGTGWQDLPGNMTLVGTQGNMAITNPPASQRYYRIFLRPTAP
jgi:hypothetical protein